MKIKWTGAEPITIRGVTFDGKGTDVSDEALIAKVLGIPGFEEVKRGRKKKNDEDER